MSKVFLGIDLGTSNTKASIIDRRLGDNDEIVNITIPQLNSIGDWDETLKSLPSVVYFEGPKKVTLGAWAAQHWSIVSPEKTILANKRQIGRPVTYKVDGVEDQQISPEFINALILKKIRLAASNHLGGYEVRNAVITVPASFSDQQRRATQLAAKGAGFEDISLVDEPTAALLDDLISANFNESSIDVLVYDIGGGTLDVSVVRVEQDGDRTNFSVLAHSPYTELAGTDFDLRIAAMLYRILQVEKTIDSKIPDPDKRIVFAWLRQKAEQIKKDLADRMFLSDPLKLPNVVVKIDPFSITYGATDKVIAEFPEFRMSYEDYFEPLFNDFLNYDPDKPRYKTVLTPVRRALEEAYNENENQEKLPLEELIKKIGLVKINGGMGKLPLFEFELRRFFAHLQGDQVKPVSDLMHSVARGASIRHAMNESEGKFGNLQMTGDRLFESVFVFREGRGLDLLINKNDREKNNHKELIWPAYSNKIRIPLYTGFSKDSPSLSLHKEFLIELQPGLYKKANEKIYLWWEIDQDRTITYYWSESLESKRMLLNDSRKVTQFSVDEKSIKILRDRVDEVAIS